MLFTAYLAHTHKPQSIKLYLSAVRTLHLEHGVPDPTTDVLNLRRLMRGIKRVHGCTTDSPLPITPSLLCIFRSFLNLSYSDHFNTLGRHTTSPSSRVASSSHSATVTCSGQGICTRCTSKRPLPLQGRHHCAPIWQLVPLCSRCLGFLPSEPSTHRTQSVPLPDGCPHMPEAQPPHTRPGLLWWSGASAVILSLLLHRSRLCSSCRASGKFLQNYFFTPQTCSV